MTAKSTTRNTECQSQAYRIYGAEATPFQKASNDDKG